MQLNHLHLCVQDVAAVASFFVKHFGFNLRETRGRDGFAVLTGDEGFVLALMRLPAGVVPEHAYPPMFHVGFLVADEALLECTHAGLIAAGWDPAAIVHMRGARRFYCKAPGGLLIEVGHDPGA
jgi:catechol 2,3-dioxygenase-like lactoylglutathione lyase family enzyme